MRKPISRLILACLLPLGLTTGLSACISSSDPPPPAQTTIIVPQGATAICSDGTAPPCR